jgi:D-glycero-alpha-D-manno-heptose 1-phosphate guanylyltransferase
MQSRKHITALILAGGLGTRLKTVVSDRPKILASVNGRPFICYLMDQLIRVDFKDVMLCTGYKGELVRETFGSCYAGLNIRYSTETEPMGTGGALRLALTLIENEIVLVMNGDSYCDVDLSSFIKWYVESNISAAMLLTKVSDTRRYGRVEIDKNGLIKRLDEKGDDLSSGWINAGIYMLQRSKIHTIPPAQKYSLEHEFFPKLVGKDLYGYKYDRAFIDIGTPESYAEAEDLFYRGNK